MKLILTSFVAAMLASGAAIADTKNNKGGASAYAPGHQTDRACAKGPGQSGCAPGQRKPDGASASDYTPAAKMKAPPKSGTHKN